jgi:hypothetical protein
MTTPAASASPAAPRWAVVQSPAPTGSTYSELYSVSCVTAKSCMAVGAATAANGATSTLTEAWDGAAWTIVPSPNVATATAIQLSSVSCSSTSACMAVGYTTGPATGEAQALAELWDGSAWSIVATPSTEAFYSALNGVSCVTPSYCKAVGETDDPSISPQSTQGLVESWDGHSWSIVASPVLKSGPAELRGVHCAVADHCVAVGVGRVHEPLIESWSGTAWRLETPSYSQRYSYLESTWCVSAVACVAVGYHGTGNPDDQYSLANSWYGGAWSLVSSANRGTPTYLGGVACLSETSCVAVGYSGEGSSISTAIESWSGTKWSLVSSPSPGADGNALNAVSCAGGTCVAVGLTNTTTTSGQPLIEAN